ncbi:hypothetical protein JCM10450v2_002293 [Rhodotorula kratochvilovae]
MAAPARVAAAPLARSLATQAAAPARPRRLNRRTARSSPQAALAALTELYHLAPTFVPAHDPAALSSHITSTLATPTAASSRPKPHDLRDLVTAQALLDVQRVKLDAGGSTHTGLLGVDVKLASNAATSFGYLDSDDHFDHRASFYAGFAKGAEPPLAQRLRRVVDTLHGTEAGGRAGPVTLREQGGKAVQWREGLAQARRAAREQEQRQEEEALAFADAFEQDERRA